MSGTLGAALVVLVFVAVVLGELVSVGATLGMLASLGAALGELTFMVEPHQGKGQRRGRV